MFRSTMLTLSIYFVLIFNARCILSSRVSKIGDKPSAFDFTSVNTSDHFIDLSIYADHYCLNHRHLGIGFSSGFRDSITIMPKQNTGCFVLYNEYNCQGTHLKFHCVDKEKILRFDLLEIRESGKEKLVNFAVDPSSIGSCVPPSNSMKRIASRSDYSLRIANKRLWISDECSDININWEKFAVYNSVEIILRRNPFSYKNKTEYYSERQICIETFSQRGCTGEMIQFIIPEPFTENDRNLLNQSIILWHVSNVHLAQSIDTDIVSIRNCAVITTIVFADNRIPKKKNDSTNLGFDVTMADKETTKFNTTEITTSATEEIITIETSEMPSTETIGGTSDSFPVESSTTNATIVDVSQTLWKRVAIIIGVKFLATVLTGLVYIVYRKWNAFRFRILTQKDIDEFKHGVSDNDYNDYEPRDDQGFANETALRQPYNRCLEIPKEKLQIFPNQLLGGGEFGRVVKAMVLDEFNDEREVASKMSKPNRGATAIKGFLSEIKILTYLGQHPNIVPIVGAYTAEMYTGTVYIATELCPLGSLRNCLKSCQDDSKPLDISFVPLNDMIRWSYEIACGIEYLEQKKVIHADLATRNVLLSSESIARISDFGLSRRMYEYANYTKASQEPLPWRWMAYESLKRLEFSTKSDVWSYGVTLWEIYCLASQPYPGISWTVDFVENLEEGLQLKKPRYASEEIYEVMKTCWNLDKKARPSFTDLKNSTRQIQTSVMDNLYTTIALSVEANNVVQIENKQHM